MTDTFTDITQEIPRDRWSRPLVIPVDGGKPVPYTRCTTYVDCLDDKYNLQKWQQRMVAVGIAQRPDIHLAISACANDPNNTSNKRQLDTLCDSAREAAAASSKATVGTALHALTERIDRGQEVGVVPPGYNNHLKAYEKATTALTAVHIEQFMVNDDLKVGGTPDRIVRIDGHDGLYIVDVKTGPSTLKYGAGKVAMQMAMYAHSKLYRADGARGTVNELNLDRGIVISLDAETGQCELLWIDIAQGWKSIDLARQVRSWRAIKPKDFLTGFTPAPSNNADVEASLDQAIAAAGTVDELLQLWAAADKRGSWQARHTEAAAARKAELSNQTTAQATA